MTEFEGRPRSLNVDVQAGLCRGLRGDFRNLTILAAG